MGLNIEKEKRAIQYLRTFEPQDEPYYLCYSGGKDSDVIKILAYLAGVKFEAWHNHTTVDAPETVYYIRSQPDVHISHPRYNDVGVDRKEVDAAYTHCPILLLRV